MYHFEKLNGFLFWLPILNLYFVYLVCGGQAEESGTNSRYCYSLHSSSSIWITYDFNFNSTSKNLLFNLDGKILLVKIQDGPVGSESDIFLLEKSPGPNVLTWKYLNSFKLKIFSASVLRQQYLGRNVKNIKIQKQCLMF